MSSNPIVIERLFNAPISQVWKAITDREEMKKWYFNIEEFKAEVGFRFQFLAGEEHGKQYLHLCEVKEVIPGEKLCYSWRYDGYTGDSLLTFELVEQNEKTLLELTHQGIETFASGGADFARESFLQGWTYFMDTALKNYLEAAEK